LFKTRLWVRGGIFYGETFGNRGGVEFSISRNQRHCFKPHRLTPPIPFKGSGKLDGIIGTKAVTVMLAYSFLVWQEWQQRQERARPGRPRRAFSPSGGSASQDAAGNPSADLRLATPRGGQGIRVA
jgi:hypothetical protein